MSYNMIKRPKTLFTIFFIFFLSIIFLSRLSTKVFAAPALGGVDRWVNGSPGHGTDTDNDCTDSHRPCASIQHAADQTDPGDTVNVWAIGTYSEVVAITRSGEAEKPIFYHSWPGTGVANLSGLFIIGNSEKPVVQTRYIGIAGFKISNPSPEFPFGVTVINADHILLENLVVYEAGYAVAVAGQVGDIFILNNTFYTNPADGPAFGIVLIPDSGYGASITIENNIIAHATIGIFLTSLDQGGVPPEVHDYNDLWNNQTNYGNVSAGAHDITSNPLFVNAAGGDFRTSSTSPVIDAGTTPPIGPDGKPLVTQDINGVSRPQGAAYDIGAYEYVPPTQTSSSSSTLPVAPTCGDDKPSHAPELFQLNTTNSTATLYFTPVNDNTSKYFIAYGTRWVGDEEYGVEFNQGAYTGVLNYTVGDLAPNTTYYFKIRAGNGCMPGDWSNSLSAKTTGNSKKKAIYYLSH